MDINENLVIKFNNNRWEDITKDVEWIKENYQIYKIKYYKNCKEYPASKYDIKFFKFPKTIDFYKKIVFLHGFPINNIDKILRFNNWIKIFYSNGTTVLQNCDDIAIMEDQKNEGKVAKAINYLKEISKNIDTSEDSGFLYQQLSGMSVVDNSCLSFLFNGLCSYKKNSELILYPFKTNESQKEAIKNALEYDISIIKGPPGTGKTQTILNIIANFVYQNKKIAVLSGNNEATKNVFEKLKNEGYENINAFLGNSDNISSFFQNGQIEFRVKENDLRGNNKKELEDIERKADLLYDIDNRKFTTIQKINELKTEKDINDAEYYSKKRNIPKYINKKRYTLNKLLELSSVLEKLPEKKITNFFVRVRLLFRFGIINADAIKKNKGDVEAYLKNQYYPQKNKELENKRDELIDLEKENKFDLLEEQQIELSKKELNKYLYNKYKNIKNYNFTENNYRYKFEDFLNRYPVIYSTTHSIRYCSQNDYLYDCIIIDEASQVDLISAFIAFSCAKKVVLVGDEKQITHVVRDNQKTNLHAIFENSKLDDCFDYVENNIIQCAKKCIPNLPSTLLKEHYRCDPQIISFCNKRFYNNQLIIKTNHVDGDGVQIKTHIPHFERSRANQREADIIKEEILDTINKHDAAIITPYRNQVDLLRNQISSDIPIDTIHKFQGREKDTIILSTVQNDIRNCEDEEFTDFLNRPNLINVAISRAKKHLYIVSSKKVIEKPGSILRDLSNYCNYYCSDTHITDSKIYSIFDLLYDDYSPYLEKFKKGIKTVSKNASENIMAKLLDDMFITDEFMSLSYKMNYPLKYVIKSKYLSEKADLDFVNNINTHCDFVIYSSMDKAIKLVIEVDGSQHNEPKQKARDERKDRLLKEFGIKVLRIPTNSIKCEDKIKNALRG